LNVGLFGHLLTHEDDCLATLLNRQEKLHGLVAWGRAVVIIRNYIDCLQKRALFWAYNGLFEGKNGDIGSNDFRLRIADFGFSKHQTHNTQGVMKV
jgi:hypothetical protein